MKGALWAFSGLDGAGKTTQITLLTTALAQRKIRVRRVWARVGYTPTLDWLRAIIRRARPNLLPPPGPSVARDKQMNSTRLRRIWLVVSMLDLLFYLGVWVRLLRMLGYQVVADRWVEDSELDLRLNFSYDAPETWWLWRFVKFLLPKPTVHFLFLIPVEESMRRSREKEEPFPDDAVILKRRLDNYSEHLVKQNIVKMDGLQTRDALHARILQKIRDVDIKRNCQDA
jgi:thymidylate kinase